MADKKEETPPLTKEERVQITREAIRLAVKDFLDQRKQELDKALLGFAKRIIWYAVTGLIMGLFHVLMHGKYQRFADWIVEAVR